VVRVKDEGVRVKVFILDKLNIRRPSSEGFCKLD
jgi:hypothetical protein